MKSLISLYLSIHPLWRMACDRKMKHHDCDLNITTNTSNTMVAVGTP
ncbi:MAG: hypothetical protein WBZ20_09770 [Nitrososphaeraceae archaeon]